MVTHQKLIQWVKGPIQEPLPFILRSTIGWILNILKTIDYDFISLVNLVKNTLWLRNFDVALTHLIYKHIHHSMLRTTTYKYLTFYFFSLIGYINRILGSWIKSSTIATLFSTFSIPFSTSQFPKIFNRRYLCTHLLW